MATYDYLKSKNGHEIQVESAKRDGAGKNIENNYAKQNGYYAQLTSGNADQLNSTIFVTDQVPYLFRTSGGDADIGNREYDKIIGGSLVVNQQLDISNFASTGGTVSTTDGIGTFTANASGQQVYRTFEFIANHKYITIMTFKTTTASSDVKGRMFANDVNGISTTNWQTVYAVGQYTVNQYSSIGVVDRRTSGWDAIQVKNAQVIDLTAMFGSTIADYIYSLEQANTGAGVSWFRQYFQELYYPYNTGAIKNVQLISHDTVGFNQWDEQWEVGQINTTTGANNDINYSIRSKNYINVLPNTTYYLYVGDNSNIFYYDKDYNYLGYSGLNISNTHLFTTPSNAVYIRFYVSSNYGTTYNHDICINLSWSGWRNGQYEQYKKNSYPLDTTIELRGIPKLDADNHLYFDGDEYTYDGKVVRKYGVVDLGTLNYTKSGTSPNVYFIASITGLKKTTANTDLLNVSCSKYTAIRQSVWYTGDKVIFGLTNESTIAIKDTAYNDSDAATFKTAMSSVMLVYELAASTEETAEPYQEIQIVDDFGTEEYVVPTQDGWQIPVGHDTKYPANLRDKLQRLPDMPSVSQNVTETYVVNYNGTTKKCTFAEINAWLSSNGYEKASELPTVDAVGGTLRQCLCVKASLDFDNTAFVDLGSLSWTYETTYHYFYSEVLSNATTNNKCLSTKYKSIAQDFSNPANNSIFVGSNQRVVVKDTTYTDATIFKAAMKGVLLAYEKA